MVYMLDKKETEKIIEKIMYKEGWTHTSLIEWLNEDYPEDMWCRFLTTDLGTETLSELIKHFDIYISCFDINTIDKTSKLTSLYKELIEEDDEIMFQVQVTEKESSTVKE